MAKSKNRFILKDVGNDKGLTPGVKDHSVLSEGDPQRFMIDELAFDRPGKPITGIEPESLINHFGAAKAGGFQHRHDRRAIGSAPVSGIII